MDVGRMRRLNRIIQKTVPTIFIPIDHGFTMGPISGLETVDSVAHWITHKSISAVIAHKGIIEKLIQQNLISSDLPLLLHLNGMISTSHYPYDKKQLTKVTSAVKLGCDGVSVDLNFDGESDADSLTLLGRIVDEAHELGLPVLAMIVDRSKLEDINTRVARLRQFIRASIEMGADIIKVAYTLPNSYLAHLLKDVSKDIPILIAGGEKKSDAEFLEFVECISDSGGHGLCVGRNVFQRPDAGNILHLISVLFKRERCSA